MQRRIATLLTLLLTIAGTTFVVGAAIAPAHAADRDCDDFNTQAAAQDFFIDNGGPQSDPHGLDADGNGIACESNPCPCSTSTGGGGGGENPPAPPAKRQQARIIKVIDGDTATVKLLPGPKVNVRFLGIDAPEVDACGGARSTTSAEKLLPPQTRVLLVSDPTQSLQDKYGRLLRYVQERPKDISLLQVRRGLAKVLTVGKPFQRAGKYQTAQEIAKKKNLGNWADCY